MIDIFGHLMDKSTAFIPNYFHKTSPEFNYALPETLVKTFRRNVSTSIRSMSTDEIPLTMCARQSEQMHIPKFVQLSELIANAYS